MTVAIDTASSPVLGQLESACRRHDLGSLSRRLGGLAGFIGDDLAEVELALKAVDARGDLVSQSAHHLLGAGGKRLRPLCVALAARCGTGFDARTRQLAVAVELVHNATLLHDDVVDWGEERRGHPTARVVYGNAASIFAGDWLLVEALRRVRSAGVEHTLDRLLEVIDAMISAEATQLSMRGRTDLDRDTYWSVIEGKTASLFVWAMEAGARAGGLSATEVAAVSEYGRCLGLGFQIVDDTLDFVGDAAQTGKDLFADLREGKVTLPLIEGLERDPELDAVVARAVAGERAAEAEVVARLARCSAITACRDTAQDLIRRARDALEPLPLSAARTALAVIADASLTRTR